MHPSWRIRAMLLAIMVLLFPQLAGADEFEEPVGTLTLAQAVSATLSRNPELSSNRFELQAAAARIVQARLVANPELGASFENFAGSGSARGTEILESTLTLSQVLDLGGTRARRVAVGEAERDLAQADAEAKNLGVLVELTQRFIEVAAAQERAALAKLAAELSAKTLAAITIRVQAARSPEAEQSRATIARAQAALAQQRAEYELETARRRLAAMWGSTQPAFVAVEADLSEEPPLQPFETLVTRLDEGAALRRFRREQRARDAELALARAQRIPGVTVGAGVRRFEESGDSALVANLSFPLPLFDRNQGAIAEAEAKARQLPVEQRAAYVEAHSALFDRYQQLQQKRAEAKAYRNDIVPQARKALEQTEYGYQRGRFSYLELVDARRDLIESQRAAIDAAAESHQLAAEIEGLTGGPAVSPVEQGSRP